MTFKVDFDKLSKEKSKEITKEKKWEIGTVKMKFTSLFSKVWTEK